MTYSARHFKVPLLTIGAVLHEIRQNNVAVILFTCIKELYVMGVDFLGNNYCK